MDPKQVFKKLKEEKRKNLTELESRKILKYYKIPVVKGKLTTNIKDVLHFAREYGFPVVLKIVSKDILHKSDVGGVFLNIENEDELKRSYRKLLQNVKRNVPKASIEGVFIQKMIKRGYEVIVGGIKDKQFGSCVSFGLGGIYTEIYDDVSFRITPITKKDAEDMIKDTKAFKILNGFRNKPRADMRALVDILLKTSRMLSENPEIKELDINPVFAQEKGAIAVDARIILV